MTSREAEGFGFSANSDAKKHVRQYRNGRDLASRARGLYVIDLYGLDEVSARRTVPELYQHLAMTVRPERESNRRDSYRNNWWLFGEPRRDFRAAMVSVNRYIATVDTAAHRIFQMLPQELICDDGVVCVADDRWTSLGILSSSIHVAWATASGGWLGIGNDSRYLKTKTFDPFPFPDATPEQRTIIGDLAEELDATRKEVLAEHIDLTLTGLYNLREKLRQHGPFTPGEQDQRRRGRVDIIAELHDRIDAAVADAYGWPRDLTDEAIITRLVALNAERHAEEKAGKVRWLRPDYQLPRAGVTVLAPKVQTEQLEALLPAAATKKPAFPREAIGQTAAVLADLRGGAGLTSAEIARRYAQGLKAEPRIAATLAALVRLGHVAAEGDRYTLRRAA
ncbi:hypothetical protein ABIB28_003322 [Sphingomonas sp. UYEF23]